MIILKEKSKLLLPALKKKVRLLLKKYVLRKHSSLIFN